MPKRLHFKDHLALDELERRYGKARDPVERSHYQILWLIGQHRLTREVAAVTGYSRNGIGQGPKGVALMQAMDGRTPAY